MKIATWNVNGIRARQAQFCEWVARDRQRCAAERLHELRMLGVELAQPIDDAGVVLLRAIGEILNLRGRNLGHLSRRDLRMPAADAMLFDFSDSEWHFGLDGAIEMANAYPDTPLLLHHWGCVDAPDFPPFNADPASLPGRVENPARIHVVAPGEPFELRPLTG